MIDTSVKGAHHSQLLLISAGGAEVRRELRLNEGERRRKGSCDLGGPTGPRGKQALQHRARRASLSAPIW